MVKILSSFNNILLTKSLVFGIVVRSFFVDASIFDALCILFLLSFIFGTHLVETKKLSDEETYKTQLDLLQDEMLRVKAKLDTISIQRSMTSSTLPAPKFPFQPFGGFEKK